ncbi:MAG: response regulator [Sulfuricellaceae bacterium]|nr:response regulator [Sulfuricellaceae bacterium]
MVNGGTPPLKLLLVTDEVEQRVHIGHALAETGLDCQIDAVEAFQSAFQALRANRHDICLLDFDLKGYGGRYLLRMAREEGWQVPFLLLLGDDDERDEEADLEFCAREYVYKDMLRPVALRRSIRHALKKSRIQGQLA